MAVWAVNQSHHDSHYYYTSDELAVAGIAAAALYGASAVVGFIKTRNCRAAILELEERLLQVQPDSSDRLIAK